jgi:hypothetical protein
MEDTMGEICSTHGSNDKHHKDLSLSYEPTLAAQLPSKSPAFYVTRKFITVFIAAYHMSASGAKLVQPTYSKVFSVVSFLQVLLPKPFMGLPFLPCMLHVLSISSSFI